MKKQIRYVTAVAALALAGIMANTALSLSTPGVLLSDAEAAAIRGGCLGATTSVCTLGCAGTYVTFDVPSNPKYSDPTGTASCCTGNAYADMRGCSHI